MALVTPDNPQTSLELLSLEFFFVIWVKQSFRRARDGGLDEATEGDLVRNPVTDGPTVTVKLDVNTMTDISHPLTFPVITTTVCVGAKCFSFWCFLSRENEIMPSSNRRHWGLKSLSHPDRYPGDSWQTLHTLKGFIFLVFWGGQLGW